MSWTGWETTRLMRLADLGRRGIQGLPFCCLSALASCCSGVASLFIAISRAVVNHDDSAGTAPDPLVWSAGSLPKKKAYDYACCAQLCLAARSCTCFGIPPTAVCAEDVCGWPYSVGIPVDWVIFLGTLHWPAAGTDLGVGGISYLELLILYELWAGERLVLEKAESSLSATWASNFVPFGPGVDIWRSCRLRSCVLFRGGLGRFLPCRIGADLCRLRHTGWKSVVMDLLPGLERLLRLPFSVSFWFCFGILPILVLPCHRESLP